MAATITRADVERELWRELIAEELGLSAGIGKVAPDDWGSWLRLLFPQYTRYDFADHHAELWDWGWSVEAGQRPAPFVEILARGGAKSTTAELMAVAWGARRQRKYLWYVSETQDQADDHVGNIASMLESEAISRHYPALGERMVGKFGNSRGWRRNRLRTAEGYVVDALGLDVASRGVKLEEQRPDAMIFDDLDRQSDGPEIVAKKIRTLTRSILPAGTDDLAVLAIQNLIHESGIFARLAGLAEETADFLADRIVSGPHPALLDAAYEPKPEGGWKIVAGTPTWEGQNVEACQRMVDTYGLSSFEVECQHKVDKLEGALFSDVAFRHCAPDKVPDLVATTVWVDPAVSETDKSDSHGIQADGLAADGTIYRLRSWEGVTSPVESLKHAIMIAIEVGALGVGVETDQGGDTWMVVYQQAWDSLIKDKSIPEKTRQPAFMSEKAGAGNGPKVERAQRMLADYERGAIVHVIGDHAILEKALRRFPVRKPYDLTDGAFWSWRYLRLFGGHTFETKQVRYGTPKGKPQVPGDARAKQRPRPAAVSNWDMLEKAIKDEKAGRVVSWR